MPTEANEIMASALEDAAAAQEQGERLRVGEAYNRISAQIVEADSRYDDAVAFALTFWDEWADAANHDWRYHDTLSPADWPRFARQVAHEVRRAGFNPAVLSFLRSAFPRNRKGKFTWPSVR